ncbi:sigma-70 family RNA polymerase sigma factor [Streptomyces longwoodensis]|uniref:sigma-70 family RNA polymerase sigma factor n=1 Tax=Streptomyces longwoodensis TaxID=68231 RepID=UPI0033EC613C
MRSAQTSTTDTAALVTAARAGDQAAQDALVGAYLPLVYNIVGRALNGSVDVDDVVQESMLRALGSLDSLRAPESFRPWLVAIVMNQVRAHWQGRTPAGGPVEDAWDVADPGADFVDLTIVRLQLSGQRQETARATRWLEPADRALLSLWWLETAGELTRAEVAAALELTPEHTAVRVQRMKAQLEAARVVVRAVDAQPPCPDLRTTLAGWDGRPSALWRKRIARHARDCARCSGLWSGLVPAEGLLAGLALVAASPLLLERLRTATDTLVPAGSVVPQADGADHLVSSRPGAHAAADRGLSRGAARRRRRTRRRAVGGAVVAACLAGGGLTYVITQPGEGTEEPTAARGAEISPAALPPTPAPSSDASPSPSPSARPSRSASPSASASPTPSARTTSPTPSPRPVTPKSAAASPRAAAPAAPSDVAGQVLALVNQERKTAGCAPLTTNDRLRDAAQAHSDDMAARDFFDHVNPDGTDPGRRITAAGYRWSTYGENIAKGQQTARSVMTSWMNSPGHRANILNCAFKNLGVGVHRGDGGPYWTQDFGTRM